MDLEINTLHESYPPQAAEQVRERLEVLTRLDGIASRVRAVIEREGEHRHHVELVASSWGRAVHRIEAESKSLMGAVNEAVQRMERTLRRREERHRDQQRRQGGTA
ncbi:Sigma 54 modulation protein / S30EA ribosomal protein [Planctomycetes bacterium Pla163]|uniref:Sigma 54 modulation protein / S30EA ribosomal protein n=1 Tax=Rohdeia mirabilis TaxID=2528008 RepID=A0A518D2P3_9BACT|nr:Sigma 54 modulation protein / S30EA ribosomal protein [Planctomycetes bacterium Pla163]